MGWPSGGYVCGTRMECDRASAAGRKQPLCLHLLCHELCPAERLPGWHDRYRRPEPDLLHPQSAPLLRLGHRPPTGDCRDLAGCNPVQPEEDPPDPDLFCRIRRRGSSRNSSLGCPVQQYGQESAGLPDHHGCRLQGPQLFHPVPSQPCQHERGIYRQKPEAVVAKGVWGCQSVYHDHPALARGRDAGRKDGNHRPPAHPPGTGFHAGTAEVLLPRKRYAHFLPGYQLGSHGRLPQQSKGTDSQGSGADCRMRLQHHSLLGRRGVRGFPSVRSV